MKTNLPVRSLLAARGLVIVFLILLTGAPRSAVAQSAPPEASAKIAQTLQPFVDTKGIAGAVTLVAGPDKILAINAVGFANIAEQRPMRTDAMFWIASQSKSITAAAFMILVDQGKIALDDPIEKYLPEFKDLWVTAETAPDHVLLKRPEQKVTVRHILSHTSGIPFKSALETPTLDGLPLADAVRSYAMTPLMFQPTTKYQYSNAGINTAGRLIEVLSGQKYEDFLDHYLLEPCGMKDTTYWPSKEQLARLATGYKPNQQKTDLEPTPIGQLTYPLDDRRRQPMPAGGLFSTAGDCARFCQMILNRGMVGNRRILSEPAVKELTTRQTPAGLKESYGLGFSVAGDGYGHGGAMATNMHINPQQQLIYVFLIQQAGGFLADGKQAQGAFRAAAQAEFVVK